MHITIKTIKHKDQDYPTVGNWKLKRGKLSEILVSDMENEDYEFLVGIHELIEAYFCKKNGITQLAVDEFDKEFERNRRKGNTDEPGNDPKAPYGKYHRFATSIEMQIASMLGVNWEQYEKSVNEL